MSASRHLQRLSAFENVDDPSVAGLRDKIGRFQKKQQRQSKKDNSRYDWVQTQRKLHDAEDAITKQVLNAGSNILECIEKEKDLDGLHESCGIDSGSRVNAMKSLQEEMSAFQNPIHTNQDGDILSHITEVRESFNREQSDVDTDARQQNAALHAQWLLELKESLVSNLEYLDEKCNHLSKEIKEHRKNAMQLLSAGENDTTNQHSLPESLSRALASLATIEAMHSIEDGGEVDLLESELRKNLEEARNEYESIMAQTTAQTMTEPRGWGEKSSIVFKKTLSSSNGSIRGKLLVERLKREIPGKTEQQIYDYLDYTTVKRATKVRKEAAAREYNKKCQVIEMRGIEEIGGLKRELNLRSKRTKSIIEQELKNKQMKIRLQAMRVEREEAHKAEDKRQLRATAMKASNDIDKEVQRSKQVLEAKQTTMKHKMQQIKSTGGSDAYNLQTSFADEIENLNQQEANKERTCYREDQMKRQLMAKERADIEALRSEERRLEKLSALAASVPYYKAIMATEADIHRSTKAREHDFHVRSKLPAFCGQQSFFSTEQLETNTNFRLGNALHAAGLANSTYARDVVRQAIPRSEARTTGIQPY